MPNYSNLRTPSFFPEDIPYDYDPRTMPNVLPDDPPPLDAPGPDYADPADEEQQRLRDADSAVGARRASNGPLGGSPTQVDFPSQPPQQSSQLPAADEREALINQRQQQKPPGMLRRIAGTIVGGWVPSLGQEIANPGNSAYQRQLALVSDKLKTQQEALKGRDTYQDTVSKIKKREDDAREAQARIDLMRTNQEALRAQQTQNEADRFEAHGGQ